MGNINKILVVSRMTKYCAEAVQQGVSLARTYDAELFLVHVLHNPFGLEGWNLPMVSLKEDYQKLREEAKADLDRMVAREREQGLRVTELIREGDPTEEIITLVEDYRVDLLIMLAHQEGRLEHFLFGRSNDDLIRRLPCSILLVKKEPGKVSW